MAFLYSIIGFFEFWTLGFWLLFGVWNITVLSLVENDHRVFPAVLTLVLTVLYWPHLHLLNWRFVILGLIGYAVAGMAYSIYRWRMHVRKVIQDFRKSWVFSKDPNKIKQDLRDGDHVGVDRHKSMIVGWIVYWPWCGFWSITGDLTNSMFEGLRNTFQRIADKAIEEIR
jgi:prepilin signal peptidase PulO-like enzyme (type II secretory pathway)